jgi:hypothetical protein
MDLEYKDFVDQTGTEFTARATDEGDKVVLELVSVAPLPRSGVGGREQPFSAEFQGPAEPLLPQQIHHLSHGKLGAVQLFLVPLGPDPATARMRYEAIFN